MSVKELNLVILAFFFLALNLILYLLLNAHHTRMRGGAIDFVAPCGLAPLHRAVLSPVEADWVFMVDGEPLACPVSYKYVPKSLDTCYVTVTIEGECRPMVLP